MTAPFPAQAINPATTRVMVALTAEHEASGRATVKTVALRAGRSVATTHYHLALLRPTTQTLNPTSSQ